jgi:hypothetical protein
MHGVHSLSNLAALIAPSPSGVTFEFAIPLMT